MRLPNPNPIQPRLLYLRSGEDGSGAELVIGMGDGSCQVYLLLESHLRQMAIVAPDLLLRRRM